jgi:hypothetical protein
MEADCRCCDGGLDYCSAGREEAMFSASLIMEKRDPVFTFGRLKDSSFAHCRPEPGRRRCATCSVHRRFCLIRSEDVLIYHV